MFLFYIIVYENCVYQMATLIGHEKAALDVMKMDSFIENYLFR